MGGHTRNRAESEIEAVKGVFGVTAQTMVGTSFDVETQAGGGSSNPAPLML